MEVEKVLLLNYLPYAKGVIIGRAIPSIDGLKPVQRRVLYTMYSMGLLGGNKTKSANIVGQTMQLHPHGDSAIYETMVRMTTGHDALNVPYVESKGNFGKFYSKQLAYAASRYTEAKLAPICAELFDCIDEDAVDFIDNYDNSKKEPTLLPVKFPSILVNPSSGIAVGTSSNIPSFGLKEVCEATIGVLTGKINSPSELMDVLGTPEFSTGGFVHATKYELDRLGETGKGSFVISGSVITYPNKIVITEIPYKSLSETILDQLSQYAKSGELKEISAINDNIDLKGFKLTIELKRGSNPSLVLQKMCRLTDIRVKTSFRTRVIINDRCEDKSIYELLQDWINFRVASLNRINKFRFKKKSDKEHILKAWEKISNHLKEVVNTIHDSKTDEIAKNTIMQNYGLDDIQAEYILELKIRKITQESVLKAAEELKNLRAEMQRLKEIIESDQEKYKIIVEDLTRIGSKYGRKARTHRADAIQETNNDLLEAKKIDDALVSVYLSKEGYIKRLITMRDESNFEELEEDPIVNKWLIRNNEYILVFTYSGTVHKVVVDSIDASRGKMKNKLANMLNINKSDIMYVDAAKDFSGYFNLVMPNGRGTRVYYSRANGSRAKYKGLYDEVTPGAVWITKADKFFMITSRRKASYVDLTMLGKISNRSAFKVARVNTGDSIFGLQPEENVPDISKVNLDKYNKPYCVNIGEDVLWAGAEKTKEDSVDTQDDSNSDTE